MQQEVTFAAIVGFEGLDQALVPGTNPRRTRSLDNVEIRNGRVLGVLGTAKYRGITAAASNQVLGLMQYQGSDLTTNVLRVTLTKVEKLNTATDVWDNVTGTALTGAATDLPPQSDMHKGVLVFTNDGKNRPRKYTNSGNTAQLAGTPPFCKALVSYLDYLILFNFSTDGTTFFPRQARYSNDYDNDWSLCEGNELSFNETAGAVNSAKVIGRLVVVGKSDAVIQLRSVPGGTRFFQDRLPFDQGVLAPRSMATVGNAGAIFLATDSLLYITDGQVVKPLPLRVQRKLQDTMDIAQAKWACGTALADDNVYHLIYPTSVSDTANRGRISYNFQTGEFYHRTYDGHQFTDIMEFRLSDITSNLLIASATDDRVYQMEAADDDDDGTPIDRYYDTDWQSFDGSFTGARLIFRRRRDVRIKISVAADFSDKWLYPKWFDLRGSNPTKEDTEILYRLPTPLEGRAFNLRINFYHGGTTNVGELHQIHLRGVPRLVGEENVYQAA